MKILLTGVFALWFGMIALPVQAATCNAGRILPACACSGNCSANDFIILFINIAQLLLSVVGLLALLFFVAGGLDWITSGGSSEKVSSGRSKMVNAVVGMVIVIAAWAIMNTVYYVFAGSNTVFGGKWFELKALEDISPPSTAPPTGFGGTSGGPGCDPATLAENPIYNNPLLPHGDSAVQALRHCIEQPNVTALYDPAKVFTYELDHPLCNYTRGDTSNPCTPVCSHRKNSCHYGGSSGTAGAMAIDYNANLAVATEAELWIEIQNNLQTCPYLHGYANLEGDHSHVSVSGCNSY